MTATGQLVVKLSVQRNTSPDHQQRLRQPHRAALRHHLRDHRLPGEYRGQTGLNRRQKIFPWADVLRQFDQQPEYVIYLVPMVISMLRAGWKENLDAVTAALHPFPQLAAQARRILDMPDSQVKANLADQPAVIRHRVERLIEAAIEGNFEVDNTNGRTGVT